MKVINGDRPGMPGTEARAVEWLRADTGPGIAVSGVHVAGRGGRGRECDLVVLTPAGPAVIEVKGLVQRVGDAVLRTSANARWTVEGIDGDPVHVGTGDVTPFDQVGGRVFDVKNTLGDGARVDGAVLVMAHPGTTLQVDQRGPTPFGLAVLAGNGASDLLGWLHGRTVRDGGWTAQRAAAALDALGVTVPPIDDLVVAGFSDDGTSRPARSAQRSRSVLPPLELDTGQSWQPPPPRDRSAHRPARTPRRGLSIVGMGAGAGALVLGGTALGLALLVVLTIGGASEQREQESPTPAGSTWVEPTGSPEPTETTPPPAPAPPPPPKPPAAACYPFQPDC